MELEKSHVTRNGDECGVETTNAEINYFCAETKDSMSGVITVLKHFHAKVDRMVGLMKATSARIWKHNALRI